MSPEGRRKRPSAAHWLLIWSAATIALFIAAGAANAKPRIHEDPISYGVHRRAEMAAYSHRHYGDREYRLTNPQVVVLHFTATDSYSSVWSTFDSNAPNMGELPGVCSHYVIEQDGTINELVPPRLRCRHTIGLNYTAIGIEMVQATGRGSHWADQQILARGPQIRAALRLVRWLQSRYGIPTGEVIGHAMANDDPHFKDREGWVNDHTDWLKRDVKEFRARLRR
jgi:N-acetyl-anhydromuramyl-L-alanine amidase AmpD